ncbi:hypothetical protein HOO68_05750 [Candidatus Gracilibacteria bacterium]|nr:hypothetical protein [Candidatus Gracilibacteria bacterium]
MSLEGLRTYLMGAGIIIHQVLMFAGIDVSNEMMSQSIDAILAIGAMYFRWQAAITAKKDIKEALYTPVPKDGGGK